MVQIIGGLGPPDAEVHATELCRSVSRSLGCRLTLLPVPGIVADERTRDALLSDVHVQRAVQAFDHLDLAFVGVGAPTPDSVTMRDGSIISQAELDALLRKGAVGDVALHYFDAQGRVIASGIDDRLIGITLEQLTPSAQGGRRLRWPGQAGGPGRGAARRTASTSSITDSLTAARLLEAPDGRP